MKKSIKTKPILTVFLIWLICFLFRALEYFIFRTDQTFFGEAFIHKLIGIVFIFVTSKLLLINITEIGFTKKGIIKGFIKGLIFGLLTFLVAYIVEIFILIKQGNACKFDFFIIPYSSDGTIIRKKEFLLFFICIVGNIINVIMEEGMFRGVFPKILESKYSFIFSAIISSLFFGLWHIMSPLRNLYDGAITTGSFIANALMLISVSALVGLKFAMITKLTGNLYMAMGDHFLNNTIGNVLYLLSKGLNQPTVIDTLSFVRIGAAQTISFIIVLVFFIISRNKKNTQETPEF